MQCEGFPEGHACPVMLGVDDADYCRSCLVRRKAYSRAGLSGLPVPVGVILEDFEAPQLQCVCGGVATAPDHEHSLLHAEWAWRVRS